MLYSEVTAASWSTCPSCLLYIIGPFVLDNSVVLVQEAPQVLKSENMQLLPWMHILSFRLTVCWKSSIVKQEIILWNPLKQILLDNLHQVQNNSMQ